MLSNFQKSQLDSLYHNIIGYFAPVLAVFLFGFHMNYPFVMEIALTSDRFHTGTNILAALVVFSILGKVIYEITSRAITLLETLIYTIGRSFASKQGALHYLGEMLCSLVPTANGKAVSESSVYTFLSENIFLRSWHTRLVTTSKALETGLGCTTLGLLLFAEHRVMLIISCIILLLLSWSTRKKLLSSECEIETHIDTIT